MSHGLISSAMFLGYEIRRTHTKNCKVMFWLCLVYMVFKLNYKKETHQTNNFELIAQIKNLSDLT